jgi:hypothetical protein
MRLGFVTKSAVSLALAIVCLGCGPTFSNDEVARVSSPDGTMDAVLFESNAGATTSLATRCSLARRASAQVRASPAFMAQLGIRKPTVLIFAGREMTHLASSI